MVKSWVDDVLTFWFQELEPADWFKKREATDRLIESRFGAVHHDRSKQDVAAFMVDHRTALAAIIVFDQFSRNIFRGTPKSFASDGLALCVATQMVAREWDRQAAPDARRFIYLPFEHSENLADQDRSVALMETLADPVQTEYAHAHRDVIVKFGRFPHRNDILGRRSTPDEVAYLATPGSGF